jgi:hypothetical protein
VTGHEPGNYDFLHFVPPPEPTIDYTQSRERNYRLGKAILDALYKIPKSDTLETEDIDLVNCFEIKVPNMGCYKCPNNHPLHAVSEACQEEGCMEIWNNDDNWLSLDWEELPSSVVTVLRTRSFRPEACMKDYQA